MRPPDPAMELASILIGASSIAEQGNCAARTLFKLHTIAAWLNVVNYAEHCYVCQYHIHGLRFSLASIQLFFHLSQKQLFFHLEIAFLPPRRTDSFSSTSDQLFFHLGIAFLQPRRPFSFSLTSEQLFFHLDSFSSTSPSFSSTSASFSSTSLGLFFHLAPNMGSQGGKCRKMQT